MNEIEIIVKCAKNHVIIIILFGTFLLVFDTNPSPQKREQLSLLSLFQTSLLSLIQFLDERHLRYVLHNHDIIHLLVLLP